MYQATPPRATAPLTFPLLVALEIEVPLQFVETLKPTFLCVWTYMYMYCTCMYVVMTILGCVHCRTKVAAQAMEICRRGKTPAVQQSVYDVNQNSATGGSGAMMANLLPTSCGNLTLSFNNHMNSLTNQVNNITLFGRSLTNQADKTVTCKLRPDEYSTLYQC